MKIPKLINRMIFRERDNLFSNIRNDKYKPLAISENKSEREIYIEGVKHGIAIALSEIENYKPSAQKE